MCACNATYRKDLVCDCACVLCGMLLENSVIMSYICTRYAICMTCYMPFLATCPTRMGVSHARLVSCAASCPARLRSETYELFWNATCSVLVSDMPCIGMQHALYWDATCPVLGRDKPCIGTRHALYWDVTCPVLGCDMPCIGMRHALYWDAT